MSEQWENWEMRGDPPTEEHAILSTDIVEIPPGLEEQEIPPDVDEDGADA